jgi:hypothetical protein
VRGDPAVEAVLLTGLYGVGKSTVAAELAERLEQADVHYAALDLDWLAWGWSPEGLSHDEGGDPLLLENLDLVVGNYRRRGNDRFVLAGTIPSGRALDGLRATIDMPLRIVRLTLPPEMVRLRLAGDPTAARAEDLARTVAWAADEATGPSAIPVDLVIANDGSVETTAAAILSWLGWLPTKMGSG